MLANVAFIGIIALLLSKLFDKIKLPAILGMILTGILFGKYSYEIFKSLFSTQFFNSYIKHLFLSNKVLGISSELRIVALIVILIRAGLGISKTTLNKIGVSAFKMSFMPCIIEGTIILLIANVLFGLPFIEAGILAFTIAAVSPAVVVPSMLSLKEKGYGNNKEVPTLILAGSSIDDVFAITIFGAFLNMTLITGAKTNIAIEILKIPLSIIIGVGLGLLLGYLYLKFITKYKMRDTKKLIIFMIIAILFYSTQELNFIPIASLLGIMAMGFIILEKNEKLANILATKFSAVWVLAEIVLFVLIGAEVNITVVFNSGLKGVLLILIGLVGRSIGVFLSLIKSGLNVKEKFFCVIAYLPKATVQAAIGGVALSMVSQGKIFLSGGKSTGELILAIAVLSIIVTAPLGAIGIKAGAEYLLNKGEVYSETHEPSI